MGARLRGLAVIGCAYACLLALPAVATAATYCVHANAFTCPAGSTDNGSDLQAALNAAAGTAERDTVQIALGLYNASATDGFSYDSPNPVDIVGAGGPGTFQNATVIQDSSTPTSNEAALLVAGNASSTVSDLQVATPTGSSTAGLETDGEARRIVASPAFGAGTFETGVRLRAGGRLRDSYVNSAQGFFAVTITGPGAEITDSHLLSNTSALGSTTNNAGATLRRVLMDAQIPAEMNAGGSWAFEDVLAVVRRDTPSSGPLGFIMQAQTGSPLVATFDHVTVVAFGQPNSNAFQLSAVPSSPATLTVRNSIVSGWANTLSRSGDNGSGAEANATFSYSDVPAPGPGSGPGSVTTDNLVTVDPMFVDPTNDDFRLAFGSPLIDAGNPAGLASGEQAFDLAGAPRAVDASGGCVQRTDMGAYEFQTGPRVPRAIASASPTSALTGADVSFDASASCDPDGDALSYAWRFDDGATAVGAAVTHAFAAAGRHSGTVTVTDATGRTDTATVDVSISTPVPPVVPAATSPFAGVRIVGKTAKVKKGAARVKLACPKATKGSCSGTLTLKRRGKSIGSKRFKIAPGKTATVVVKLTRKGRAALRAAHGRLKVSASAAARDGAGKRKTTTAKLTLT